MKTVRQKEPKQRIYKECCDNPHSIFELGYVWVILFTSGNLTLKEILDQWERVHRRVRRMAKELKTMANVGQFSGSGMGHRSPERLAHIHVTWRRQLDIAVW